MNTIKVKCALCGNQFSRQAGQYREAVKLGWHQYCSSACKNRIKILAVEFECGNPDCSNMVSRNPSQFRKSLSGKAYCSQTCAAISNNHNRKRYNNCNYCGKKVDIPNKYCSHACIIAKRRKPIDQVRSDIIDKIKKFHAIHKRIPVKREMYGPYKIARLVLGSWNKAVEAAGFDPNPVLFAKKFIANDGHVCDSFAEKVIDDWLLDNNIPHERSYPYSNPRFTADFKIGNDKIVEFFGLAGVQKEYDNIILKKRIMSEKSGMKLIELYPKDIYPTSKLKNLLGLLV